MKPLPDVSVLGFFLDVANVEPEPTTIRRVDITKALDRGATLAVFVGPGGQQGAGSPLGNWLLNYLLSPLGLSLAWGGPWDVVSGHRELRAFFRDQVAHAYFNGSPADSAVLARVRPGTPDQLVLSVRIQHDRSAVFVVPLRSAQRSEEEALRLIHMIQLVDEYPEYLDELDLGGEENARTKLHELQEQQSQFEAHLLAAHRAKRILYIKHTALQQEVGRFLTEELGIPARFTPGNREDFELVDAETGKAWCIGEVKGRENANVTKGDVNAITNHRSDAELGDEYPALLAVNTFQRRRSVEARDEPVHPDVIHRAVEDHVVVVRTLDLVRIKRALRAGDPSPHEQFLSAIQSAGGWFEASKSGSFGLRVS